HMRSTRTFSETLPAAILVRWVGQIPKPTTSTKQDRLSVEPTFDLDVIVHSFCRMGKCSTWARWAGQTARPTPSTTAERLSATQNFRLQGPIGVMRSSTVMV